MKTLDSRRRVLFTPKVRASQQGIVLIFALLVLVSMTLAGAALMRSVDSATLLSINLSFRQNTTVTADKGVEAAIGLLRGWAVSNPNKLLSNDTGYFATLPTSDIDFTGSATGGTTDNFNWSSAVTGGVESETGNQYAYVIHRLCGTGTVALDAKTCSVWLETMEGGYSSAALVPGETYRDSRIAARGGKIRGLYRITVRVAGPRDTYSYVQATVVI